MTKSKDTSSTSNKNLIYAGLGVTVIGFSAIIYFLYRAEKKVSKIVEDILRED